MAQTVADHLVDRLEEWGIRTILGYSGDGINGILGALDRAGDRFEFVQPRHEEMAAFMAAGFAKFTDGDVPGVYLATSGPGAIHLLNGLYDAKMDHQPVVAIIGQKARMWLCLHDEAIGVLWQVGQTGLAGVDHRLTQGVLSACSRG